MIMDAVEMFKNHLADPDYEKASQYLDTIAKFCDEAGIPYSLEPFDKVVGLQIIIYDEAGVRIGDAVCGSGSYGHSDGLLEGMGILGDGGEDDVEGYLTATDIIEKLINYYNIDVADIITTLINRCS